MSWYLSFIVGGIMEKRRHQRTGVNNLAADISDGKGFFSGTVRDLSRYGIKLADVSRHLNSAAEQLSIVISGKDSHFKMKVRPRWTQKQAISKIIGLEIVNAPLGWAEFVMDHEPTSRDLLEEIVI